MQDPQGPSTARALGGGGGSTDVQLLGRRLVIDEGEPADLDKTGRRNPPRLSRSQSAEHGQVMLDAWGARVHCIVRKMPG